MNTTNGRTTMKAQIELEDDVLLAEHEAGEHDGETVEGCEACEAEDVETELEDPPFGPDHMRLLKERGAAKKKKKKEKTLVINGIDVLADLRAGLPVSEVCKRVGVKRGKLKRMLAKEVGGDAYAAARSTRTASAKVETRLDAQRDRGVPRTPHARVENGWRFKTIFVNYGGKHLKDLADGVPHDPSVAEALLIDPNGELYVAARNNESADLIVDRDAVKLGLDPIRLRRFETSAIFHLVKEHDALVARGEEALKRTREEKKVKRIRRKGGMS